MLVVVVVHRSMSYDLPPSLPFTPFPLPFPFPFPFPVPSLSTNSAAWSMVSTWKSRGCQACSSPRSLTPYPYPYPYPCPYPYPYPCPYPYPYPYP